MQQKWWSILFGAVLAAAFLLTALSPLFGWWLPSDKCAFGPDIDRLFYLILGFTGFFFVLTEVILVYAMYRFAETPGRKGTFVHGNHRLELMWTAVPAAILLFIAFAQITTWDRIKYQTSMPEPDQVFEVSARQFEWRLRYPNGSTLEKMVAKGSWKDAKNPAKTHEPAVASNWSKTPQADDIHIVNEVHTWKGAKVRLYLKTRDVIHSFFLPNMRIKQDALPGKTIPVWFEPLESNTRWDESAKAWSDPKPNWELACAELCGWGHYKMRGKLYVHETKADFDKWLGQAQQAERRTRP